MSTEQMQPEFVETLITAGSTVVALARSGNLYGLEYDGDSYVWLKLPALPNRVDPEEKILALTEKIKSVRRNLMQDVSEHDLEYNMTEHGHIIAGLIEFVNGDEYKELMVEVEGIREFITNDDRHELQAWYTIRNHLTALPASIDEAIKEGFNVETGEFETPEEQIDFEN
jgi:hypothetical protein